MKINANELLFVGLVLLRVACSSRNLKSWFGIIGFKCRDMSMDEDLKMTT